MPLEVFPIKCASRLNFLLSSPLQYMHTLHLSVIYGTVLLWSPWVNHWSASRGHESEEQAPQEMWQAESWKTSSVEVQIPTGPQGATETRVSNNTPHLKSSQLCYSLCSATLLLGEKWKLYNSQSHSPWHRILTRYYCTYRDHYTLNAKLHSGCGHHVGYKRGNWQQLVTFGDHVWVTILTSFTPFFVWVFLLKLGNWFLSAIISILLIIYLSVCIKITDFSP